MSNTTLHPPGDKLQKAILEFSELLEEAKEEERQKILQKVVMKFDLSPKEGLFLERNCLEIKS